MRGVDDLADAFGVDEVVDDEPLAPSYNVAPTDPVHIVRSAGGARQLRVARWGLVPSWADDPRIGARMINARYETVGEKPAFRTALARRRCVVPADGYYEWYADAGAKRPHFLHRADGGVLGFAGLYEVWRDPRRRSDDEPGAWLWSCTIVTTAATDDLGHLHDRMPMVVPAEARAAWLDAALTDPVAARALPVPAAEVGLTAYPVSPAIGDVRNNGPHLVEPAPDDAPDGDSTVPTLF